MNEYLEFLQAAPIRLLLTPLSHLYYIGYRLRRGSVERRGETHLPVPVISVGNITAGGTGKTPVARYLAEAISSRGKKPGVCLRGYGRKEKRTVFLSSSEPLPPWEQTGDEAPLYVKRASDAAVGIDRDRVRAAQLLIGNYKRDVIILDDGFQYRTLHRDLNIAVIDAARPFGFGRLLPAGLLREPITTLAEADLLWLTRADLISVPQLQQLRQKLSALFPGIPMLVSRFRLRQIRKLKNTAIVPAEEIASKQTICFSGIGNPASFEHLVRSLAKVTPIPRRFPDHHPFTVSELRSAEQIAATLGITIILTTEKDEVRIPQSFHPSLQWYVIEIEPEIIEGEEIIESMLRKIL